MNFKLSPIHPVIENINENGKLYHYVGHRDPIYEFMGLHSICLEIDFDYLPVDYKGYIMDTLYGYTEFSLYDDNYSYELSGVLTKTDMDVKTYDIFKYKSHTISTKQPVWDIDHREGRIFLCGLDLSDPDNQRDFIGGKLNHLPSLVGSVGMMIDIRRV